jgi:hypothetical protein
MAENPKGTEDTVTATKQTVEGQPSRQAYLVVSKAGLFKNGKHYKKGTSVELDDHTANNFKAAGDIEDKE